MHKIADVKKNYHFIGIGGVGMSALASLLLQRGVLVSGSESSNSSVKQLLRSSGAKVFDEQKAENIQADSVVVYSSGIPSFNPELLAAKNDSSVTLLHRSELLAALLDESRISCVIAGTHGKTTTTAMLAAALRKKGGSGPSFAIGGLVLPDRMNGFHGKLDIMVAEGDESDGSFLNYRPTAAIMTNSDNDHLDHYTSFDRLNAAYLQFARQVSDERCLVWNGDDPSFVSMKLPGISVGRSCSSLAQIVLEERNATGQSFSLKYNGHLYEAIQLRLFGDHNMQNGAQAFVMALALGFSEDEIREGLSSFQGVARRFERVLESDELTVIDDYAHHPREIAATLQALKSAYPFRRLFAVLQPHRFSRFLETAALFKEALRCADLTVVTDIYAAGEAPFEGYKPELLIDRMGLDQKRSFYVSGERLIEGVEGLLKEGDVVIGLGAGDITASVRQIAKRHAMRGV